MESCDSIISEIPILTVALFWSSSLMTGSIVKIGISDIIESQGSTIFTLFKYLSQSLFSQIYKKEWRLISAIKSKETRAWLVGLIGRQYFDTDRNSSSNSTRFNA